MEDTQLNRKDFLKGTVLGSLGLLLSAKSVLASEKPTQDAELPDGLRSFAGEPSIGESGYENRVARLFGATRATRY
ncbi:MAG: hypothetical protein P8186_31180 [Anaerolineae bacterium]|jgi:hypothetical protein